jgi:hypothetical protein
MVELDVILSVTLRSGHLGLRNAEFGCVYNCHLNTSSRCGASFRRKATKYASLDSCMIISVSSCLSVTAFKHTLRDDSGFSRWTFSNKAFSVFSSALSSAP